MTAIEKLVQEHAAAMARDSSVEVAPPSYLGNGQRASKEPSIRTVLTNQIRNYRMKADASEELLHKLPEELLTAPISLIHQLF